ncbi:MAG: DUF6690 family protein [Pirellulaceae bacterium]
MFGKRERFVLILLAAVAVPYLWFDGHWGTIAKEKWQSLTGGSSNASAMSLLIGDDTGRPHETAHHSAGMGSADALTSNSLEAVLRFDISPLWVTERWERVSTVHTSTQLRGLRVPLVTGTELDDLVGSLTYYFDHQKRLQRISFHGQTGDERKVVAVCSSQFGLRSEPTLGMGMYVTRWNARPTSILRISFAPIVRAQTPHRRLKVALEINRPDRFYSLSPEFEALLD